MKILGIIFLILVLSSPAFSKTQEKIKGENFQRTELLDCQTYSIDKFKGVHREFFETVCYYRGYFYVNGKEESVILVVKENDIQIIK